MKNASALVFGLIAGFVAGGATAAPSCRVEPGRPKLYQLELTVPATFCASQRADPSCRSFPKPSLIQLHGLWPNYDRGYPAGSCPPAECREQSARRGKYCAYPSPPGLYASPDWQALKGYMAGTEKCLERHEWVKHGTCSPLQAPAYFEWSLRKTREIADGLALPADRPITKTDFERTVATRLPDLKAAFTLQCEGEKLSTLSIRYTWEATGPGKPVRNASGKNRIACPNTFTVPSNPW